MARVGASPLEPWGLVMGWGRAVAYDHARRLAILRMYTESIDEDDDPLAGLLYVCDRIDIAEAVRRAAWDAGLAEGPSLSVWTRDRLPGKRAPRPPAPYDAP